MGKIISRKVGEIKKITAKINSEDSTMFELTKLKKYALFHLNVLNDPMTYSDIIIQMKQQASLFRRSTIANDF